MKYLIALTVLLIFFASISDKAAACSCSVPPAPLVALEQSDFVFSGVVRSITPLKSTYGGNLLVNIQVLSKWKGDVNRDIIVQTADNSAACGYNFERGKSYLIYGHVYEGVPSTNICTRTARLENAGEDLRDLAEAEEVSTHSPRCGGPTSSVVVQTFLFMFIGICFLKKKPRSEDLE